MEQSLTVISIMWTILKTFLDKTVQMSQFDICFYFIYSIFWFEVPALYIYIFLLTWLLCTKTQIQIVEKYLVRALVCPSYIPGNYIVHKRIVIGDVY